MDVARLLESFREFFREISEHWVELIAYEEAGAQLVIEAFLQKVINGAGRIKREYPLRRRRPCLLMR